MVTLKSWPDCHPSPDWLNFQRYSMDLFPVCSALVAHQTQVAGAGRH